VKKVHQNSGMPDNAVHAYKCARCGNMFEAEEKVAITCPICGYKCSENLCHEVHTSNEDY
jgi:rubrerythrin